MKFRMRFLFVRAAATPVIAFLFWLMLLPSCSRNLSESDLEAMVVQNCDRDVNRFMLDKLQNNRILMLADECHGNYMYLQRLVGFLNYWVDALRVAGAHDSVLCKKLYLVLEGDSVNFLRWIGLAAKGLEDDSITLEESWAPQSTVETVEYRRDLAVLIQRIDSLNSAEGENRIEFEVFCPESSLVDLTNWTVEKRDDYFINRRDQYSSRKVIDLLERNPDAKALVYYGSAHFFRERILKKTDKSSGYGYYLAHYLVERFGKDGGVYSLDQLVHTALPSTAGFLRYGESTFAIDYNLFPPENTNQISRSGSMDGIIVDHGKWIDGLPIGGVWSKGITFRSIEHLPEIYDTSNYFNYSAWLAVLNCIGVVSGHSTGWPSRGDSLGLQKFFSRWSYWRDTVHLDMVRDIESLAIATRLLDQIPPSNSHRGSWLEGQVHKISRIRSPIDTSKTVTERTQILRQYLTANRRQIVIDNLIPLLWVGTSDEIKAATEILKRETGEDFATAKEWTVWWRENRPLSPALESLWP